MFRSDINKFDVRLISRMLEQKKLNQEELDKFVSELEDCADNAMLVDLNFGEIGSLQSGNNS